MTEFAPGGPSYSPARIVQMLEVARLFYLEMESKVTIAERLGISRFTVSRLLDEARASGMVHIDIRPPAEIDFDLSRELVAKTNLERALVLASSDDTSELQLLAHAAASYLVETCVDEDVLGLLAGRTTNMILNRIAQLPACTIVQLSGVSQSAYIPHNPAETIRAMTSRSKGQIFPIYAPLLLNDAKLVSSLKSQIGIADTFAQFGKLTRVFFSVGGWSTDTSGLFGLITPEEQENGRKLQIAAEVAGHLLNTKGQKVYPELSDRCLTIPFDMLRRAPDRVAVGGGSGRKDAVLACVRAGLATTLVTDRQTAKYIVSQPPY